MMVGISRYMREHDATFVEAYAALLQGGATIHVEPADHPTWPHRHGAMRDGTTVADPRGLDDHEPIPLHACSRCRRLLQDDPDDDQVGAPGGAPMCGECARERDFEADRAWLDQQDGDIDGSSSGEDVGPRHPVAAAVDRATR
jgi:hypothetical protein